MASTSIQNEVLAKYDGLTAANFPSASRPAIYFDEAPPVDGAGVQVRPPYVLCHTPTHQVKPLDFERNNIVTVQLIFEVFVGLLADLDTTVTAIRWNGGTVGQGLGFDYGTITTLSAPRSTLQIVPVGEPRRLADRLDKDGKRVHGARVEWRLTVLESS